MRPFPESRYWIGAPAASLTDDRATAVLVLRLAMAVNALRSQQRYTLMIGDDPITASAKRDRVLSMLIAAAFTAEALNILTGTSGVPGESRAVRALAERAEVPAELEATVTRLMAGTHPASALLRRLRNQLTFHWDPEVVSESLNGFIADEPIIWSEGEEPTQGGSIYRIAADVLANAMVLVRIEVPNGREDAASAEIFSAALLAIVEAMTAVFSYFEYAIAGHVEPYGVTHGPSEPDASRT